MNKFLKSRNLDYLLPSFICYKIDDFVAPKVAESKLLEIGLVYGDILAYKQIFVDPTVSTIKSYEERAGGTEETAEKKACVWY